MNGERRMVMKEATARIKINKLLEAAGWRFFDDASGPANVRLEPTVAIKAADLDSLGEDFEKTERGFVDFLLLDARGFPLIVLEAKAEDKDPLVGKEQARKYARSQNCRFVGIPARQGCRGQKRSIVKCSAQGQHSQRERRSWHGASRGCGELDVVSQVLAGGSDQAGQSRDKVSLCAGGAIVQLETPI